MASSISGGFAIFSFIIYRPFVFAEGLYNTNSILFSSPVFFFFVFETLLPLLPFFVGDFASFASSPPAVSKAA